MAGRSYTPEELEAEGLTDFRVFLHQVWVHLDLRPRGADRPEATALQNDIAYFLQHGDMRFKKGSKEREESRRRQIIMAFRGVGKSFITVAFVCWYLLLNPQAKIMVVSATEPLAVDFSNFVQQLIETMPILQHLKSTGRKAVIAYDVAPAKPDKSPSLKAVGINGQLTGSRADLIIADDIEIPKNSASQIMREKLAIAVREFSSVLKPDGKIVYLGTPQVEATLYKTLQSKGYTARIWPAEVPSKPEVYHGKLAPYIERLIAKGAKPKQPTDPSRFNREDLDERLLEYGRGGYNLQFQLDTTISDEEKHPLKLRDLIVTALDEEMAHLKYVWGNDPKHRLNDLDAFGLEGDFYVAPHFLSEEMAKFTGTVLAIDPSGKGKDETGYAIVRSLFGYVFLIDVGGYRDGYGEATLESLAAKAIRWNVTNVIIEENFGGGMFANLLKPVLQRKAQEAKRSMGPAVEEVWHSGQKESRIIDTLAPLVQSHRLIVDQRVIEEDTKEWTEAETQRYSFIFQFTRITRDKGSLGNEDRLEAVEVACKWFVDRMSHDADKTIKKEKEKSSMKAVLDFIKKAKREPAKAILFGTQHSKKREKNFGRQGRGL